MFSEVIYDNLYNSTLISPLTTTNGLNRLLIVSGYATSAMGFHHLNDIVYFNSGISVELIHGMIKADGLSKTDHMGFQSLQKTTFPKNFKCSYLKNGGAVHSKVYVWCNGNTPLKAFLGSANYSQTAFLHNSRREVLCECDPLSAYKYYHSILPDTVDCCSPEIDKQFNISSNNHLGPINQQQIAEAIESGVVVESDKASPFYGMLKATISLLKADGTVPARSGLNWGQRPEYHRDPNQAYLAVNGKLKASDFFPPRFEHFTVLTDDNQILEFARTQDSSKAIETHHNNAELGLYFRKRLGLPSGAFVTVDDLLKYGRTDVDFYKIDSENYFMDFSPRVKG